MDQAEPLWAISGEDLWAISREKRFLLREEQNQIESKENWVLFGFKGFSLQNDRIELHFLQDSAHFC